MEIQMDETLKSSKGPHHCIGTVHAVADLIFRYLDDFCTARGGTLAAADLKAVHSLLGESFVSTNLEWIETIHEKCMLASGNSEPCLLERARALPTLLRWRSQEAAEQVFSKQIARYGSEWIPQFYAGLADYIRNHVSIGIDGRLFGAYARLSARLGADLAMPDLLKDDSIKLLLCECVAILTTRGAADFLAKALTDEINRSAGRNAAGWQAIEESDVSTFMLLLRREFGLPFDGCAKPAKVSSLSPNSDPDVTWTDTDLLPMPSAG